MNNNEWTKILENWESTKTQEHLIMYCDKIRTKTLPFNYLTNFVSMLLYFSMALRCHAYGIDFQENNLINVIIKEKADDIYVHDLSKEDSEELYKILKIIDNSKNVATIPPSGKANNSESRAKSLSVSTPAD